jgi:uncharacterized membrane protein
VESHIVIILIIIGFGSGLRVAWTGKIYNLLDAEEI